LVADHRPVSPFESPSAFKVFIESRAQIGGPGGRLQVSPGRLGLLPSQTSRRLMHLGERVELSTASVVLVRQPLFPPWINEALDCTTDAGETLRLRPKPLARKPLHAALLAADIEVMHRRSWSIIFGPD
jgi:hypothetical protein